MENIPLIINNNPAGKGTAVMEATENETASVRSKDISKLLKRSVASIGINVKGR
jgi:hypothetical protein